MDKVEKTTESMEKSIDATMKSVWRPAKAIGGGNGSGERLTKAKAACGLVVAMVVEKDRQRQRVVH